MFEATKIISQNNDWMAFVFLIILFLLTLNKLFFNDRILHTSTLFLQKRFLLIYYNKEKSVVFNLFQVIFFLIKILVISLIAYHINVFFKIYENINGLKGYSILLGGVVIYFLFHYLIGAFIAETLNFGKIYNKIVYEKISYFNNLILWVLPFLIIYTYTHSFNTFFFNILFFLSLLLLAIRYGLLLYNNKNLIFNNIFYFILYLCALEIAPFVIILKLTN
ncbi:protein of unknown function [Lutibacter maritimus]|uniref:DUF4271 domain-containing protein n=2 Tax=Lutibacter maritimus TaxID=593133 RepID=A0A1I6PHJ4_9FLAO|nr:protein of unknown function [Lutibacter maritimus]